MATLKQTVKDIKSLKIQGSQTIAIAGLKAWAQAKDKRKAAQKLMAARPTEPMLFNALAAANAGQHPGELIARFDADKKRIAKIGAKLIHNDMVVFTHCHSSTVVEILKEAHRQGRKFEVHNTETRPLYQGRITAKELAKSGIEVHHYVDSAAMQAMRKADILLFGADWISEKGVVNKIGTGIFAKIANDLRVPVYCCSHSWKFSKKHIELEQRPSSEVWKGAPSSVFIQNSAFELAEKRFIKGVVSQLGILSFDKFLKKVRK